MRTYKGERDAGSLRVGVVVSRFNRLVTESLLRGALEALRECGLPDDAVEVVHVPGAFELPAAAGWLVDRGRCDAIVCLGAVVRGETPHFDHISAAVVSELCRISVESGIPVALGVLTTNDMEQALARSCEGPGNKGHEAAMTAVEMANLKRGLSE